jgi:YVTN family beta-propeller protein
VTDKVTATIARPPASQVNPVNLPQLVVNEATNTVFMSNIGASQVVSVINGLTNTITSTIPVGSGPCRIAENSLTNTIYVTNCLDNTVSVINGSTNVVAATIPVSTRPTGIAVNPTANLIYVEGGQSLTMINGVTNAVIQ